MVVITVRNLEYGSMRVGTARGSGDGSLGHVRVGIGVAGVHRNSDHCRQAAILRPHGCVAAFVNEEKSRRVTSGHHRGIKEIYLPR